MSRGLAYRFRKPEPTQCMLCPNIFSSEKGTEIEINLYPMGGIGIDQFSHEDQHIILIVCPTCLNGVLAALQPRNLSDL